MAKILIIDDEPNIRTILRRRLEPLGFSVEEAPNGLVAMQLQRADPADLIITDIIMPEQEGLQTVIELRREYPKLKIVAMSGGGTTMTGELCLELAEKLGAERTFAKPLDFNALIAAVRELIG